MARRVIIVLKQFQDIHSSIPIICSGSLLEKSNLFFLNFQRELKFQMGGDAIQAFVKVIQNDPSKSSPERGAALYIRSSVIGDKQK